MNRIEYMRRLAALLQDVPVKERVAAMQYYNDYFDDAGEENEGQVIEELGSPEQVAAEMKAGLEKQAEESGEFRETGYTDTQFERKDMPAAYRQAADQKHSQYQQTGAGQNGNPYQQAGTGQNGNPYQQAGTSQNGNPYQQAGTGQNGNPYQYTAGSQDGYQSPENKPWTSKGLKAVLIILILLIVIPVLGPLLIGFAAVVFALVIAAFAVFIGLAAAAAALAVAGVAVFIRGMFLLVSNTAMALAAMGAGMIVMVIGVVALVAAVRLCIIVLPGLFRFFVNLCKKPFQKRKERG